MLDRLIGFARKEAVLCIAFACAAVSSFFVPISQAYLSYIDTHTIVLLFCLMSSVAGLRKCGLFAWCARKILYKAGSMRGLAFALVMLPFFSSMLITNDVALIAFVPFAVMTLGMMDKYAELVRIVVLQAIAANLGGMITPVGNPQNLFIYTTYDLTVQSFFAALGPFALLAFLMLALSCLFFEKKPLEVKLAIREPHMDGRRLLLHALLFFLCLLAVLKAVPLKTAFLGVLALTLAFDKQVLREVDYGLLATFICFFVFSGNMGNIEIVCEGLGALAESHPFMTSVAASQVISNVPVAVLLSEFTTNWHSLLLGVDLGGLGTPIASLASLIAFRLYMHSHEASGRRFMKEFAFANIIGLTAMVGLYALLFC